MDSENIIKDEKLNQIKTTKFHFSNLKSDYILKKIFIILKKTKSLDILKHNKKLQKRLNININDYKNQYELYSSIELELKYDDNLNDKFINIPNEDKEYYHINNENLNENTNTNYIKRKKKSKKVKIIIDYQVKSFKGLFDDCNCITSIIFKKFHRINITDMGYMFYGCSSLKELNLSYFNTNNVNNMSYMFSGCESLIELNLSNFNTNNVTHMSGMFSGCSSLKRINLDNFNTNNVILMSGMFSGCESLKELNLDNFNTNYVKDKSGMF